MLPSILGVVGFAALTIAAPKPQQCEGLSCTIAALSGSTGSTQTSSVNVNVTVTVNGEDPTEDVLPGQTANDLVNNTCKDVTVLFARGTTEGGNIGGTVGPSLQKDLQALMPNQVAFQGVDYEADVTGDANLGRPGGIIAGQMLQMARTKCPNSQIVMSGYSEGAMVSHDAVASASTAIKDQTVAVVVFGDPFNGAQIAGYPSSQIKTFCKTADGVCYGAFAVTPAHLAYVGADTMTAAEYIKNVTTGPAVSQFKERMRKYNAGAHSYSPPEVVTYSALVAFWVYLITQ